MIGIKFTAVPAMFRRENAMIVRALNQAELTLPQVFKCNNTVDVIEAYRKATELAKHFGKLGANIGLHLEAQTLNLGSKAQMLLVQSALRQANTKGFSVVVKNDRALPDSESLWEISDSINKFGIPNTEVLGELLAKGLPIYSWDKNCRVMTNKGKLVLVDSTPAGKVVTSVGKTTAMFSDFKGVVEDNEFTPVSFSLGREA